MEAELMKEILQNTQPLFEFLKQGTQILKFFCVYYSIQIGHCILTSWLVIIIVLLLRQTLCRRMVFGKGALWLLFLPVLFTGRLHFFYQTRLGVRCFYWWHAICCEHIWVDELCICGVIGFLIYHFIKNRRLKRYIDALPVQELQGVTVSVCPGRVTPFSTGLWKKRIVIPEYLLETCSEEELSMILEHEQTHQRLGHLVILMMWDLFCAVLWMNPLLTLAGQYLREDLEAVCDACTIYAKEHKAYEYGHVILKVYRELMAHKNSTEGKEADGSSSVSSEVSREALQREKEAVKMTATFAGEPDYAGVKRRFLRIAEYQPFQMKGKRIATWGSILMALLLIIGIKLVSYHRYTDMTEGGIVFSMRLWQEGRGGMVIQDYDGQVIRLCGNEVHVDGTKLQELFPEYVEEKEPLFVYCGGFYKLPGMGGGGGFTYLDKSEVRDGELVLEYESPKDFWTWICRWF